MHGVSLWGKSAYLERLVLLPLSGDLLKRGDLLRLPRRRRPGDWLFMGDLLPLRLLLPLCAGDLLLPGEALGLRLCLLAPGVGSAVSEGFASGPRSTMPFPRAAGVAASPPAALLAVPVLSSAVSSATPLTCCPSGCTPFAASLLS